jgi:putative oxidoreductase
MTTQLDSASPAIDLPPAAQTPIPNGIFARLAGGAPATRDLALVILRVGFGAALSLTHGRVKLAAPARFIEGLSKHGFPLPLFFGWAAILSEFAGGLLLAIGLLTRPAATFVLITLSVAAFDFHSADPFAKRELALAYSVVALAVAIAGPGRYSLDSWLALRDKPRQSS